MKKLLILCVLLTTIFSQHAFAQNDWRPGYVIATNNDTIYGEIDFRDSRSNSKYCFFRTNEQAEVQTFNPEDLVGYRFINDEFYISKIIPELNNGNAVFLKYLLYGQVKLYHHKGDENRYFAEKEGLFYELKNTTSEVEKDKRLYLVDNKEYIGVLSFLFQEAEIKNEIYTSRFTTKSLIKTAKSYHEKVCDSEECIVYERSGNRVSITPSVFTGVVGNKINFGWVTESNWAMDKVLGTYIEFAGVIPWTENMTIATGPWIYYFTNYTFTETNRSSSSGVLYNQEEYLLSSNKYLYNTVNQLHVNVKELAVRMPLIFNYYLLKGDTKLFIGAGVQNQFVVSINENFIYYRFQNYFERSIPLYLAGPIVNIGGKIKFNDRWEGFAFLYMDFIGSISVNEILRFTQRTVGLNIGVGF